jgi:hypothetical protein
MPGTARATKPNGPPENRNLAFQDEMRAMDLLDRHMAKMRRQAIEEEVERVLQMMERKGGEAASLAADIRATGTAT